METLSQTMRQKHGRGNRCENIDSAIAALASRRVDEIDGFQLSPVSSMPSKAADILQIGTRRCIDIAESAIREMNLEKVNSSCILTRAVLETCVLMLYTSHRVRDAVENPAVTDFSALNTFLVNTIMGSGKKAKTFFFREDYRVTNILTFMEKVDEKLAELHPTTDGQTEALIAGMYEGLSEHAHPNAHGMVLTYVKEHKIGVTKYVEQKQSRVDVSMSVAMTSLAAALQFAEMANKHWDEDRVPFILACEKNIYDQGTWPAGTPYPIPRHPDGTQVDPPPAAQA